MAALSKSRWDVICVKYVHKGLWEIRQRGKFIGHIYEKPWGRFTLPVRPGTARLEGYARDWLEWMFEKPGYTHPKDARSLKKAGFEVEGWPGF
jgi:hypothetical protein